MNERELYRRTVEHANISEKTVSALVALLGISDAHAEKINLLEHAINFKDSIIEFTRVITEPRMRNRSEMVKYAFIIAKYINCVYVISPLKCQFILHVDGRYTIMLKFSYQCKSDISQFIYKLDFSPGSPYPCICVHDMDDSSHVAFTSGFQFTYKQISAQLTAPSPVDAVRPLCFVVPVLGIPYLVLNKVLYANIIKYFKDVSESISRFLVSDTLHNILKQSSNDDNNRFLANVACKTDVCVAIRIYNTVTKQMNIVGYMFKYLPAEMKYTMTNLPLFILNS